MKIEKMKGNLTVAAVAAAGVVVQNAEALATAEQRNLALCAGGIIMTYDRRADVLTYSLFFTETGVGFTQEQLRAALRQMADDLGPDSSVGIGRRPQ